MDKKIDYTTINFILLGVLALLLITNQIQLMSMTGAGVSLGGGNSIKLVGASSVIPIGTPKIYGNELDITYDDVSASNPQLADQTIEVMSNLDRTIELQGADLERYIKIVSEISCEYCCGANSIIFPDGRSACGCAHSYAMRGIAKYLITEHGNEFSDDEILTELAKWKTLYFPGVMQDKADIMKEKGIEFSYIALGSNMYRGIEQDGSGGGSMVGGC